MPDKIPCNNSFNSVKYFGKSNNMTLGKLLNLSRPASIKQENNDFTGSFRRNKGNKMKNPHHRIDIQLVNNNCVS